MLFSIYVDSIIQRLRVSGYGCIIGTEFFGCIMYADDLVLVSHSICVLQKMIDICADELNCLGLAFNAKKSCYLRFGVRYKYPCEAITLYGSKLTYVNKAR